MFDNYIVGATFSFKGIEYNSSQIKAVGKILPDPPFSWIVTFVDRSQVKLLPDYTTRGTLQNDRDDFVCAWHNSMV